MHNHETKAGLPQLEIVGYQDNNSKAHEYQNLV